MLSRVPRISSGSSAIAYLISCRHPHRLRTAGLRVYNSSSTSSSSSICHGIRRKDAVVKTMGMFEDYNEAIRNQKSCNYVNSLTFFDRVLQIISYYRTDTPSSSNSSGVTNTSFDQSDLLLHTLTSYNRSLLKCGYNSRSIKLLKDSLSSFNSNALNKVKMLQLLSRNLLLDKDFDNALKSINDSIGICEKYCNDVRTREIFTLNHLVDCYNLKGAALLLSGDFEESEAFFQNAFRFSNYVYSNPSSIANVEEVTSAINSGINFGSLFWHKREQVGDGAIDSVDKLNMKAMQESLKATSFLEDFGGGGSASREVDDKVVSNLRESISVWEGVYNELSNGRLGLGSSESGDFNKAVNSCSTPVDTSAATAVDISLFTSDASFVSSYVHLLCNLSEGYIVLDYLNNEDNYSGDNSGEKGEKKEQRSVARLSEALKAVDAYLKENISESSSSTTDATAIAGEDAVRQAKERVLSLLGNIYATKMQAVTAEGLYRTVITERVMAATAEGSSSISSYDPREIHNIGLTIYRYGNLLKKWEKREFTGDALVVRAQALFGRCFADRGSRSGVHLNHFIRL